MYRTSQPYNFTFQITPDDHHYLIGPAKGRLITTDISATSDIMEQLDNGNLDSPLVFDHSNLEVRIAYSQSSSNDIFTQPDIRDMLRTYWYPDRNVYITYDIHARCIRQIVETSISHSDDYVLYHFPVSSSVMETGFTTVPATYIEMTEHGCYQALICAIEPHAGNVSNIKYYQLGADGCKMEAPNSPALFNTGYTIGYPMPTAKELVSAYIVWPDIDHWIDCEYKQ